MRKTFCDNHPDREAVVTLSIKILPADYRPIFTNPEVSHTYFDFCSECRSLNLSYEETEGLLKVFVT